MLQSARYGSGACHRGTGETSYLRARWTHVFTAFDETTRPDHREWRSQSVTGALQYARRSAQIRKRAGQVESLMLTDKQVQEIRSRFSIFQRKIYLNSCSQGALSDAVQAGLEDFVASWHEQGSPWETWVNRHEAGRNAFAQFIHASPDEVAILTSVSAGINGVASALPFRDRKRVVMGEFEFPTMGHVWLGQRPRGADVQFVSAEGNSIPVGNYEKMIDRTTCIVLLTHVCFKNGFRSEVKAITEIAHDAGAFVMLDDYQDCGTRPVNVRHPRRNADFRRSDT